MNLTGSWDGTSRVWDPRDRTYSQLQPDKLYRCVGVVETLVVAKTGRKFLVWDVRNMACPQQQRESSRRYQTRCLSCYPNKTGNVLSSTEGRVAVDYFDPDCRGSE